MYERIKADVHLASISGGTDIIGCFVGGDPTGPVWRGEIQARLLGMAVEVFDDEGKPVRGEKGELVCTRPFPSMPLGFWNDPDGVKYHAAYFERYPGVWHHGDYVELTAHDGVIIYGRSDAVLNPGGVRIGTAEIYRQVEAVPEVLESLVIGQQLGARRADRALRAALGGHVADAGAGGRGSGSASGRTPRRGTCRPGSSRSARFPRTRSGKIVELAVRDVVHGRPVKNVEALANPQALDDYRDRAELRV